MNFLWHLHLANRDLGGAAGLGAMLPDLWRMAARPARARRGVRASAPDDGAHAELDRVLEGVEHHLALDAWFHRTAHFTEGERLVGEALAAIPTAVSPRLRLFAHVTWEMLLDGALVRLRSEEVVRAEVAGAIRHREVVAARAADLHHEEARRRGGIDRVTFELRMRRLFDAVSSFELPGGYAHAVGVARRLASIRSAFGLLATAEELSRWQDALARVEPAADEAARAILQDPRARLDG